MTKSDGRGRPPAQADVGQRVMLRNDKGARYDGILKALSSGGVATIQCFGTDWIGGWRTYVKPKLATVMGAEVLNGHGK